jgi:DNA-binding protein HU-beta
MNKGELIKVVADKVGFTQKDVSIVYDALLDVVTESLKNGEKVQLAGLGSFELKEVPAKEGINPQTKEKVEIAACKKPVMKFSKTYKSLFN